MVSLGLLVLVLAVSYGFYLPGVMPKDYEDGEKIELYVNKLDSSETQLPFDYYYLNFCKPNNLEKKGENLGQILSGDRMETSPYEVFMNMNEDCKVLCTRTNSNSKIENFKWMIDNQYEASWVMDNLPSGLRMNLRYSDNQNVRANYYQDGFPIGYKKENRYFVNNHAHIVVKVHNLSDDTNEKWRVVGFLVEPISLANEGENIACKDQKFKNYLAYTKGLPEKDLRPDDIENQPFTYEIEVFYPQVLERDLTFTYSVNFEESPVKWASRWDVYLYFGKGNAEVHWLSIINSFAMVLFLSGMVAHILSKTISRDISSYNERAELNADTDSGWKQIKGEIFRAPGYSGIFSVLVGSGVQVMGMGVLTLVFACLGFLSPAHRGGLLTTMLLLFVFMGVFAGFTSSRLYKMFGGLHWKSNTVGTAFFVPGVCFCVFFVVNLLIWGEESSGAVPFVSLLVLLVLWFGISVPLVFLGSAIGYRKTAIENPCKVNKIPKPLSTLQSSFKINAICVMAGSLPFGCMFIELSYLMKSMWHHTLFYYLFGFLFLCFLVLLVSSAEVSILMTYILLCREDYRWWWLSFGVAGSSGVYFFGYSILYYLTELNFTRVSSVVLYFGYMLLGSMAFALITGTAGFLATFSFVRAIYSLIKVD